MILPLYPPWDCMGAFGDYWFASPLIYRKSLLLNFATYFFFGWYTLCVLFIAITFTYIFLYTWSLDSVVLLMLLNNCSDAVAHFAGVTLRIFHNNILGKKNAVGTINILKINSFSPRKFSTNSMIAHQYFLRLLWKSEPILYSVTNVAQINEYMCEYMWCEDARLARVFGLYV